MNNTEFNCPSLMSDGRMYTDHRTSDIRNDYRRMGFANNNQYRLYLQRNGRKVMQLQQQQFNNLQCKSCDVSQKVKLNQYNNKR